MWARATTTVTIYLPTGEPDEWTGARSNDSLSASGVPASVIEQSRTVDDPQSGTPREVRSITGRLPAGTVVTRDARIVDAHGHTYSVHSVRQVTNPVFVNDVVVELTRNDALAT
jgi:hypothetical protein